MFSQLVIPLRDQRSVKIEADYVEETATRYRKHEYEFHDIDVIVLEGIYLLKRAFRHIPDLSLSVDRSFDTALDRAVRREQEGLSKQETIEAYRTIYFPAQRIHFQRDDPKAFAALINNEATPAPMLSTEENLPETLHVRSPVR
jgi:uridine kinase